MFPPEALIVHILPTSGKTPVQYRVDLRPDSRLNRRIANGELSIIHFMPSTRRAGNRRLICPFFGEGASAKPPAPPPQKKAKKKKKKKGTRKRREGQKATKPAPKPTHDPPPKKKKKKNQTKRTVQLVIHPNKSSEYHGHRAPWTLVHVRRNLSLFLREDSTNLPGTANLPGWTLLQV